MMKNIVVIGGGGHAKVVISVIKKISDYHLLGYSDIEDRGEILGIPWLGDDEKVLEIKNKPILALGIGQIKNYEQRKLIVQKFEESGFVFNKVISPNAIINEDVCIGKGTVVMDGVVIQSGSQIGNYCIVNTSASIDHDCNIGDFVHIAPGVTLCGGVNIENFTFIGTGGTVIQYVKIGEMSLIGAGIVVKNNIISRSIIK